MKENPEGPQEISDLRTAEKNAAEANNYLREKFGKSQERPEMPERPEGRGWHDRQDHAVKVSRILGERTGTFEPKVLKKESDDADSDKGGAGRFPIGDQGKGGGDSGSLRHSMDPVLVDKKSAEVTEQKGREEIWGRDHQSTTVQASRFDHRSACQHPDRPPHSTGQGTDNPRRR